MTRFTGFGDRAPTLGREMTRAAAWSSAGSLVMRFGTFAVGIVAARLIAPDQFGVFAVAITVHAIIVNVSDLGVSAYIVRRREDLDAVGPTVTTIALASATVLALAMAGSAPWIATQFGAAAAAGPVRILSLTVLLAGVSSVPGAVLTRGFRQDKRFLADLGNFVASTAVLLALALSGGGALALAWSRVGGQLVSTAVLIVTSPKRYLPGFDRDVLASVARFGLPLVGASFVGFLISNVDYIAIGRLLGAEPLGLYYLAFNVGSWPYMILAPVIASVTVAAFSRVRRDRGQLAERMGTSMATLLAVGLPANALIVALADPLVNAVYGERWAAAAAALALTAAYGAMRIPADLLCNVAIAEGRTRAIFLSQMVYLLALVPMTVVGVLTWGIAGAGLAHIVANAAVLLPCFLVILAPTGFGPKQFAACALRPLAASAAAAVVAHLVAAQMNGAWPALVVGGVSGIVVYLMLVASWGRRVAASARGLWTGDVDEDLVADEPPGFVATPPEAARA